MHKRNILTNVCENNSCITVPQLQNGNAILENTKTEVDDESTVENFVMQALDGFLFVLSGDGDVTYVSENVSEYLGIQQVDISKQIYALHCFRLS